LQVHKSGKIRVEKPLHSPCKGSGKHGANAARVHLKRYKPEQVKCVPAPSCIKVYIAYCLFLLHFLCSLKMPQAFGKNLKRFQIGVARAPMSG
jgi:hypothetical protein